MPRHRQPRGRPATALALLTLLATLGACAGTSARLSGPLAPRDEPVSSATIDREARLPRQGVVQRSRTARGPGRTSPQALIGVTNFSTLDFTRTDPVSGRSAGADLSTMPVLGFGGQYALAGSTVEVGLDGGLLFSWSSASATAVDNGGNIVVLIDNELLMVDVFFGLYGSVMLGENARVYVGAAPDFMYGDADFADETGSSAETAFGVGSSGRVGLEFRIPDGGMLGLCARWLSNDLSFGGGIGSVEVEGWQYMLSYTVGF